MTGVGWTGGGWRVERVERGAEWSRVERGAGWRVEQGGEWREEREEDIAEMPVDSADKVRLHLILGFRV